MKLEFCAALISMGVILQGCSGEVLGGLLKTPEVQTISSEIGGGRVVKAVKKSEVGNIFTMACTRDVLLNPEPGTETDTENCRRAMDAYEEAFEDFN